MVDLWMESMIIIVFVGVGSVVFMCQLLVDLFGFFELVDVMICLYDIDVDWFSIVEGIVY